MPPSRTKQSTAERIADQIQGSIQARELAPGTRLREEELAALYGTSRGPIREALRLLSAGSWIDLDPGKGASVRQRSESDAIDDYHIRKSLFGVAARLTAARASKEDIEKIEDLAREIAAAAQTDIEPVQFRTLTLNAGRFVTRAANSRMLIDVFRVLDNSFVVANAQQVLGSKRQRVDAARLWVDLAIACRLRDGDEAERLAEATYVRGFRENLRGRIDSQIFEDK